MHTYTQSDKCICSLISPGENAFPESVMSGKMPPSKGQDLQIPYPLNDEGQDRNEASRPFFDDTCPKPTLQVCLVVATRPVQA